MEPTEKPEQLQISFAPEQTTSPVPSHAECVKALQCYLLTFVVATYYFITVKDSKFVAFHAIQSMALYMIAPILWILPIMILPDILSIPLFLGVPFAFLGFLLLCMRSSYHGKTYKIPYIGHWIEKKFLDSI